MRVKALAAYLFILPTPASARVNARQKAWRGAICYKVQQCWTFALHASNSANHVPVSRIEFAADRACNYVSELATGQSARRVGVATRLWTRSKSSRDPAGQTEFFIPVSLLHIFNWLYSYRQLAVRIVVSAITVFWLVDNVIPSRLQSQVVLLQTAHSGANAGVLLGARMHRERIRLFTDLITNSTRLQTQIMTPAYNVADITCSGVIHCLRTWILVANISTDCWSIMLRYIILCV